jgi:hypothetical protein
MQDPDQMSATNWAVLGSFAGVIAVLIYLFTGTKLVKFIQFFLTKKQYKRLKFSISTPDQQDSEAPVIYQTPRNVKMSDLTTG